MRKTRNALLGILTLEQFWLCRLRRQNDMFLAATCTKRGQSDCLATPMVALI